VLKDLRVENVYMLDIDDVSLSGVKCFVARSEDSGLWHKHLGRVHFDLLNRVMLKDLIVGLPKIKFVKDKLYDDCRKGKKRVSFKLNIVVSTYKTKSFST